MRDLGLSNMVSKVRTVAILTRLEVGNPNDATYGLGPAAFYFSATSALSVLELKNLFSPVRAIMEGSTGLEVVKALPRREFSRESGF